jgi:methenyltetrahydrofolate cyclohydrolase
MSERLTDDRLVDLFEAFASPSPVPGGGSAAAVASGLGVALLRMAAALPRTRTESDEEFAAVGGTASVFVSLQQQLTETANDDAAAYTRVAAAYRLPKGSAAQQDARESAIQESMRAATDVPLAIMRLSAGALTHARTVAARGRRAVASDVAVAIAVLRAGTEGASRIVRANLTTLSDRRYVDAVEREAASLLEQAANAAAEAEALLRE